MEDPVEVSEVVPAQIKRGDFIVWEDDEPLLVTCNYGWNSHNKDERHQIEVMDEEGSTFMLMADPEEELQVRFDRPWVLPQYRRENVMRVITQKIIEEHNKILKKKGTLEPQDHTTPAWMKDWSEPVVCYKGECVLTLEQVFDLIEKAGMDTGPTAREDMINELRIINRSCEITEADHSDAEVYAWLQEMEAQGTSKARWKSRLRKLVERIDRVAEEKPEARPRRSSAEAKANTRSKATVAAEKPAVPKKRNRRRSQVSG